MKVYLGTDHAGYFLKEKIKEFLKENGYEVSDCGAYAYDKEDDFPDFIAKTAQGVAKNSESYGIVIGGSGQGEAMVANKIKGIRCALFYTPCIPLDAIDVSGSKSTDPFEMLKLTRKHNNANVLSLGARFLKEEDALKAVEVFLTSKFSQEDRHVRRIEKIKKLEN